MRRLSPVSNNLATTDDLSNREESHNFGGGHADESQFLLVHAAYPSEEGLRGDEEVLESGRVADGVEQGLVVGLEGGQASEGSVSWVLTET
jgi:hypothetical protein